MPASNVAAEKRSQPQILVETAGLSEEEWLAYRRKGIGGSDVAALLGISPWRTARDLYFDKLNIVAVEDNEDNWVALEMGHLLEPLVAKIFQHRTGYKVYQIKKMFQHPQYSWMLADVDYFVELPDGSTAILEIKTTNYNARDIYAVEHKKKHFLNLVNQNSELFFSLGRYSLLFVSGFCERCNLNSLTVKNLKDSDSIERTTSYFELLEEGQQYTFEELRLLWHQEEVYVRLYAKLSPLSVDQRMLTIRQLIKRDLVSQNIGDEALEQVTQCLLEKPFGAWYEKDFGHIRGLTRQTAMLMTEQGFKGFQRGEYGSTAEHLTSLQYQIKQDKERLEKLQQRIQKEQVKYEPARHISKTLNEIDGMGQKTFTGKMAISKEDYSQLTALAKEGITSRAEIKSLEQNANYYRQKYFDSANALERMKTKYNELKEKCKPFLEALEHFPEVAKLFTEKVRQLFSFKEEQQRAEKEAREKERQERIKARRNKRDMER